MPLLLFIALPLVLGAAIRGAAVAAAGKAAPVVNKVTGLNTLKQAAARFLTYRGRDCHHSANIASA